MGGAEGLLAVFVSVRPLLVTVESLQNPPPIAPNMSVANDESPAPLVGVAPIPVVGVASEPPPDRVVCVALAEGLLLGLELVVGVAEEPPPSTVDVLGVAEEPPPVVGVAEEPPPTEPPPRNEEKAESERRESPRRERGAESGGSLELRACPDW